MTAAGGRPRLLVLRALGLGDLLTGVPALRGLRRAFPEHEVVLAGPAALRELALSTGAVDDLLAVGPLDPLPAEEEGADVAVNLHGQGPDSSRLLVAARPRRLVAFAHVQVPATRGGPAWVAGEHEVDRWCRLVASVGAPADPTDLRLTLPRERSAANGAVVVHVGAASGARRWPAERWAAVVRALTRGDGALDPEAVVLTGSDAEAPLVEAVLERAGRPPLARSVAGCTGLLELLALVAGARLVLCGDTGVAHLATAAGTPSVVLFGPTAPARWGPRAGGPHTVLWAGRVGDPHGAEPDPGLCEITVEQVLDAARARLRDQPGQPAQETAGGAPSR